MWVVSQREYMCFNMTYERHRRTSTTRKTPWSSSSSSSSSSLSSPGTAKSRNASRISASLWAVWSEPWEVVLRFARLVDGLVRAACCSGWDLGGRPRLGGCGGLLVNVANIQKENIS